MVVRVTAPTRVLAVIVCLQSMAWACSSRLPPAEVPNRPSAPAPALTPPPPPTVEERPETEEHSETARDDCALIAGPGEAVLTAALTEPIDPANAPRPKNDSERLLFRQLYETLVRVDCYGRVRPGLASSWWLDADTRSWIVSVRDAARFSDGTPVGAADILASWTRGGAGNELRPDVSRLIRSVLAIDDRTLAITLRSPRTDLPLALAHTDLAISKAVGGLRWPLGTRSGGIAAQDDARGAAAASVITVSLDGQTLVRFLIGLRDPRDLLDQGVDLLLTRDPAALGYAGTLPQYLSVPLAWQRVHVLLSPGGGRSSPPLTQDARQALAGDAVRGEARGAVGPAWWQALPDCRINAPAPAAPSLLPQIVYDARDAAARDLAERFVGLQSFQRATGLTGEPLARARRLGADAGYLMSLDAGPLDPCRELQIVLDGVPWLDPETIVPLVETRLQAIVRRGRTAISAEWDGGVLLAPAHEIPAR